MYPERYDYLPLPERPKLELPDGNRIAVWVAPNVEFYEYLPSPRQDRAPWPRTGPPDVLNYAHRDYGNRRAIWRCFDLMDKYGIRGTVSLNCAVFDHFPEIARAMVDRNWDYMSHAIYNTRSMAGLSEREEREVIADVIATVKRHTGKMISGSLILAATPNTADLLAEAGVKYTVDFFHDDQPVPIKVRRGRLINIPYSVTINDTSSVNNEQLTEEQFGRMVKDQFDRLYAEGAESARIMCIATHPYVSHIPSRQKYLEDAFRYVFGHDKVWNTTGEEIADWYYANYYDQMAPKEVAQAASRGGE
jgi:peptidoglycan/xylan/chitin deacetylase (PgdA/CDA1 family)